MATPVTTRSSSGTPQEELAQLPQSVKDRRLHDAIVSKASLAAIKSLLDANAAVEQPKDGDRRIDGSLDLAIQNMHPAEVVKLLLNAKAEFVQGGGHLPGTIDRAIGTHDVEIVRVLIDARANVDDIAVGVAEADKEVPEDVITLLRQANEDQASPQETSGQDSSEKEPPNSAEQYTSPANRSFSGAEPSDSQESTRAQGSPHADDDAEPGNEEGPGSLNISPLSTLPRKLDFSVSEEYRSLRLSGRDGSDDETEGSTPPKSAPPRGRSLFSPNGKAVGSPLLGAAAQAGGGNEDGSLESPRTPDSRAGSPSPQRGSATSHSPVVQPPLLQPAEQNPAEAPAAAPVERAAQEDNVVPVIPGGRRIALREAEPRDEEEALSDVDSASSNNRLRNFFGCLCFPFVWIFGGIGRIFTSIFTGIARLCSSSDDDYIT